MHTLEQEIDKIVDAYDRGDLSLEDKRYLLEEIRDIRAANECAGNEVLFRHIVELCRAALAII